jgi:hypothetical protein
VRIFKLDQLQLAGIWKHMLTQAMPWRLALQQDGCKITSYHVGGRRFPCGLPTFPVLQHGKKFKTIRLRVAFEALAISTTFFVATFALLAPFRRKRKMKA